MSFFAGGFRAKKTFIILPNNPQGITSWIKRYMHDEYLLEFITVRNTCELHVENDLKLFHGSYMIIIPQHVSGHVRDTCMKFLGINRCKFYMLVTCRTRFRINNVSFSSTMVFA